MKKKYKLTNETIKLGSRTLYRIEALKDFGDIRKGDKGGFVESEDNLSHEGNSWIYNEAKVYDRAKVLNNAIVRDCAIVKDCAEILHNTLVTDRAYIHGNAKIYNSSVILDYACVSGNAIITGSSVIKNNTYIYGEAKIEKSYISGYTQICGNVIVSNHISIEGNVKFMGDAIISDIKDYIIFKNWWSSGRYFVWTKSNNMWSVGCFYGTGRELIEKAYKDSELSGREYERVVKYVESIINNNIL